MNVLSGKGIFIWPVVDVKELANPVLTAAQLRHAGFSHAIMRFADGPYPDGLTPGRDMVDEYAIELRRAGLQVWGFQAVYGTYPLEEAKAGAARFLDLGLDGYVVDAETAYKNKSTAAARYMDDLRSRLPGVQIALSSFRFPRLHLDFPWKEFMDRVDLAMPQVYWEQAHNPTAQLTRTLSEYSQLWPETPVFPTGAAYQWKGWRPTPDEITAFFSACRSADLQGCNFWEYGHSIRYSLWETLEALDWDGVPELPPETDPEPEMTYGWIANNRADRVNLRTRPIVSVETLMGQLLNGAQVEILERIQDGDDEWLRVRVEGLIAKRYRGQVLVRE